MQQQTVTVAYINAPRSPKGPGSIKDNEGRYWKCWPDVLGKFAVGQSFDVMYETGHYNGKDEHTIKSVSPRGAPVASQAATPRQPTAPTDAERMFCCSILNAAVQGGQIQFNPSDLIQATNTLRDVWQNTFGAK